MLLFITLMPLSDGVMGMDSGGGGPSMDSDNVPHSKNHEGA